MHEHKQSLYKLIKYAQPNFNYPFLTKDMVDICQKLLTKDPLERLGSKAGVVEVMSHTWFKDVDWDQIKAKTITAPYVPNLESESDVKYFD